MASAAMEAFAAATNKAQPQSEEELESVLNELPRRELVALSKTYGVQATLKRESLVAKLLRVLAAQLWPTEVAEKDVDVEETASKGEEGVSTNTTEEMTATVAVEAKEETTVTSGEATETTSTTTIKSAAAAAVTTKKAVEKKKAPGAAAKATAAAVVGKKTVATTTKRGGGAFSPGKMKRATPVKASAGVTPKKNMDKIHAKQSAKQMTLQEHEQAKKKRAALLLSGSKSKFSVVKKTRSKTKEIADANGDNEVAKTLSFGAAKTPVKKTLVKPTEAVSATKIKPTYKPHAGPLPAFTGDSLFSPKKVEPRPAPMAVAVMKAARTSAPKKVKVTKPTAVSKATPTKKSPVKKSPMKKSPATKAPEKKSPSKKASLDEKENAVADNMAANTTTLNSTSSNTATKTTATRTTATKTTATKATVTKPRASVKSTATSTISHEAKKETRRATFAQNAKAKSTASHQQTRTASSRISKTTTVKATTTST